MKKTDKKELFSKLSFFSKDKDSLLNALFDQVNRGSDLKLVFTPNPEQLIQARQNPDFFKNLTQADYLLPDGIGLVLAFRYLSKQAAYQQLNVPQERIPGVEVVKALVDQAQKSNWKVLLVGGRDYQAYLETLQSKQPWWKNNFLWLAAYHQVKSSQPAEEQELQEQIKAFQPDIIFVALGAPYQEAWLIEHRDLLAKNKVKLAMAVGGSFDMLLGKLKRAPGLIRKLNLEWLFRLCLQPWRLKRQTRLLKFIKLVLWDKN